MPSWIVKAAVQGAISHLPNAHRVNELFQRHVTRSLDLTDHLFLRKWAQAQKHIEHFESQGHAFDEAAPVIVELGTGWYPIVPVCLALSGAKSLISIDQKPLIDRNRTLATLDRTATLLRRGQIQLKHSQAVLTRLDALLEDHEHHSATTLLHALGIRTEQCDARASGLGSETIDFFVSNNTFEHIPAQVLAGILREFRRVARPEAVMSHFVDMADHYAGSDQTINVYNYLRFSDRTWTLFNNSLQYQNRLRLPEYQTLHHENGWRLVHQLHETLPIEVLRRVPLAPQFHRFDEAALQVYASWMVSIPAE